MPRRSNAVGENFESCRYVSLREALEYFGAFIGKTESANHIKPLHWYVACRLVIEGGFHPDDVWPRPPFKVTKKRGELQLEFAPELAHGKERTVLGGMKTKDVDVVVSMDGIGPVIAVSCKGVTGAFRNLTNRMEETIGECTNLHSFYPALVLGYFCVIRANREINVGALEGVAMDAEGPAAELKKNDIAIDAGGKVVESLIRFHEALRELQGRRGIRNDVSRYETIALGLVQPTGTDVGEVLADFPQADSPIRIERFFQTIYARYEERYVLAAPALKSTTRRNEWSTASPLFAQNLQGLDEFPELNYEPRLTDD
ncbi:hypothetical protein [Variovorax rhizosphaerae]|uniref:Restriction endonuclease n=1 Tax=Variovorax rhizosphaerae TaxID=1836200 RepID=A0ABU8WRQ9_9BURK